MIETVINVDEEFNKKLDRLFGRTSSSQVIAVQSVKQIENYNSGFERWMERNKPNYNRRACTMFDYLNAKMDWELQHAENGGEKICGSYYLDACDEKRNIVIEYDEEAHEEPERKEKDIIRQSRIVQWWKDHRPVCSLLFLRYSKAQARFYIANAINKSTNDVIELANNLASVVRNEDFKKRFGRPKILWI